MSRLIVVMALIATLPAAAYAKTIRVPADETTVQRAVWVATDGDTVTVGPGTYVERFTIRSKNIVLQSQAGPASTTIDGSSAAGNVITLHDVDRSMVVEGFTITGGTFNAASVESLGAGIYINQGRPTIRGCTLTGNKANSGGGIAAYFFSRPRIEDCWIANNSGGGIFLETDDADQPGGLPEDKAQIINTTIVRNAGFGISVIKGAKAEILKCTISHNSGDGMRSEMTGGGTSGKCWVTVKNTLITFNGRRGIVRYDNRVCYDLECNNVYFNPNETDAQWVGFLEGDPCFSGRGPGSSSIDPLYVDAANDDFGLQESSLLFLRCREGACGAPGANIECPIVAVEHTTWTQVKSLYR